jgi:hypothetical protein
MDRRHVQHNLLTKCSAVAMERRSCMRPTFLRNDLKCCCIPAPVVSLAICLLVPYAGVDRQVKVWDVRTYQPLHAYFANAPAGCLDISQSGMLAVGQGRRVQVRCRLAQLRPALLQLF